MGAQYPVAVPPGPSYGTVALLPTLPDAAYPDKALHVVTNDTHGETIYQNQGGTWVAVTAGALLAGATPVGVPAFGSSIGHGSSTTSNGTVTVTTTSDVPAGHTISVHAASSAGALSSVSGGPSVWRVQKTNGGGSTPLSGVATGFADALVPAGTVITLTFTVSSTKKVVDAFEWTGLQDAAADSTSGATNASTTALTTNALSPAQQDNSELLLATFAVAEAQTNGQWTLPGWTLLSTAAGVGSAPTETVLVAYQIVSAGSYSGTGTITGTAAVSSSCVALKGTTIMGTVPIANLIAGAARTSLRSTSNGVQWVKEPDMDIMDYLASGAAIGTDDSVLLASALAGVTGGSGYTGGRIVLPDGVFIQNQPLVNALNLEIFGAGSEATVFKAGAAFPTATLNGSHTFPTGTVTLTSMPANAPTGGGVITLPGLTVVYAAVSGSTLTGCTTNGSGTFAGGTIVGWPMWQIGQSWGSASGVFHSRLRSLTVNCNDIAGSMGIYTCRAQEKSGAWDCIVSHFLTYGIKVELRSATGVSTQNWGFRDLFILPGAAAAASCRAISISGSGSSALNGRGFEGVTIDVVSAATLAAWAVEVFNIGDVTFDQFNIEHHSLGGFLLGGTAGDVSNIRITRVTADNASMGGDLVKIQAGANKAVIIENLRKGSCTNAVNDVQNTVVSTKAQKAVYHLDSDGGIGANY